MVMPKLNFLEEGEMLMEAFTKFKNMVDRAMEGVCVLILFIMTCLVTYQVITRFVFNNPSAVSEIMAQYLFVWLVMLGSTYVFGLREHLSITLLKDKMPPTMNCIVEILICILLIAFAGGVCLYGGYENTSVQMGSTDASLKIPMGVIYSVIPISGAVMCFYAVYNIFLALDEYKKLKGDGEKA